MEDIVDRESLINYFMTLPTSKYDRADLEWIIDLIIEDLYAFKLPIPWGQIANNIFNWRLMDQVMQYGWIAPDGKILYNKYAIHEQWTYLLGFDSRYGMELAGYIHFSRNQFDKSHIGYMSTWRATAKQRRALKRVGCEIDNSYELGLPILPEKNNETTV